MFAASSQLVVDEPSGQRAQLTRPSNVMPGYYALWAEATADAGLARDSRSLAAFSQGSRAPDDGTLPLRARFDGTAEPGSDASVPEGYRAQLSMTLDHVFTGQEPWYSGEADSLLGFLRDQGVTTAWR